MGKREFAAKDAVALAAARRLVDAQADALRSREGQIAKLRDQVGMKAAEVTLAALDVNWLEARVASTTAAPYVRLPAEDVPILLAQFAKKLLGAEAVDAPLPALRERLATVDARAAADAGDRVWVALQPDDMLDMLSRYLDALAPL